MPAVTRAASHERRESGRKPQRLILCFDGTGNKFAGTPGDTNVVKLYNMFQRTNADQMHYYQPGIGTYPAEGPVNVGFFRGLLRSFEATIDQALATSFDSHVIAGYRFLMRYYNEGDKIYIFGFSRGAFTARFLARMVSHVGLLSRGNDEMANFAYQIYQEYEQARGDDATRLAHAEYMKSFTAHFCRSRRKQLANELEGEEFVSEFESGIKVHFLGLFDCVNSVGTLDVPFFSRTPPLPAVRGTASFVRHAVAIDERRVKFKAALFAQERPQEDAKEMVNINAKEDIKEVWFPGNHGDIGGGWAPESAKPKTTGWLWWKKTVPAAKTDVENDEFQLSDIALKWMMDELDDVESQSEPEQRLAWEPGYKKSFLRRFTRARKNNEPISATMHDTMAFGMGSTKLKTLFWKFMEFLPIIKRWEYVEEKKGSGRYRWEYVLFPLNMGGRRDIPSTALFHHSVIERMRGIHGKKEYKAYKPTNEIWVQTMKWLKIVPESVELDHTKKPREWQLDELARREREEDKKVKAQVNGDSDTQQLVGKSLVFEKDDEATLPTAGFDHRNDQDSIYHVEVKHS